MKGAEKVESWLGIQKQREREEFLIQTNIVLLLPVVNQLNYLSPHQPNERKFLFLFAEKNSINKRSTNSSQVLTET